MNARRLAFAGALGACIALTPAWARAEDDAAQRKRVEPKEALVRRLVDDSRATTRIQSSGNAEAARYLEQASARHADALRSLSAGDYVKAERELDEAMRMAARARQLVPDAASQANEWSVRNASLRTAVRALRASYESQLRLYTTAGDEARVLDATLAHVDELLDEAQAHSTSGQLALAHASLRAAEADLLRGFVDTLGNATLRYDHRFSGPAEEYAYELARHASYRELVPIARDQLRPGPAASAAMERDIASAATRLKRAESAAARADYRAAILSVRSATSQLESALVEAGLEIPRTGQP